MPATKSPSQGWAVLMWAAAARADGELAAALRGRMFSRLACRLLGSTGLLDPFDCLGGCERA